MFHTTQGPGDLRLLTWMPDAPAIKVDELVAELVADAYLQLTTHLEQERLVLMSERVFGDSQIASVALNARARTLGGTRHDPGLDPTFIEGLPAAEGLPAERGCIAGIHAVAIAPAPGPAPSQDDAATARISWNGQACGRIVTGSEARYLVLGDVSRTLSNGPGGPGLAAAEETRGALHAVLSILEAEGWQFHDVVRTWFYLRQILDWYDKFNHVRNAAFRELGLLSQADGVIPASTGIGGRGCSDRWCTLDLLAATRVPGQTFRLERLSNPQQNEAVEYGSAFARGLSLTTGGTRSVFVSGTASIDDNGVSVNPDDFVRQTELTLTTVASLLEEAGAGLGDIGQATAFIKRPEDVPAYRQTMSRLGLDALPAIAVIGDVCRPELLFELDATAILPAPGSAGRSTTTRASRSDQTHLEERQE